MHSRTIVRALFIACAGTTDCRASVIEYNNSRAAWMTAAGSWSRIDFTGFAEFTIITNQYSPLGVTFTDGTDRIRHNTGSFPNDEWGLHGALDEIAIAFDSPNYFIAVDHPGNIKFRLYWQGELTYSSSDFLHVGNGFFAGLISDQPFDAAVILDPTGGVFIDDLYFGPPIPAPGALGLLLGGALLRGSRRRRS